MKVSLSWYDRREIDGTTIFATEHHGTVIGKNADDCMHQIIQLRYNHDLAKYTPIEIVYIQD